MDGRCQPASKYPGRREVDVLKLFELLGEKANLLTRKRTVATSMSVFLAIAAASATTASLVGQTALAQLGLTEASARNFVLNEVKSPAANRASDIAVAGTRAFLRLPASARGAAATGLFAWAKAYVNSPAFKASYEAHRQSRLPRGTQYSESVEEALKKEIDEQRAGMEQMKKNLAASGMPPAEQAKILAEWEKTQALANSPEFIQAKRKSLEDARAETHANEARMVENVEQETPADPQRLFARRLREFLEATADVNFSARTVSLTDGPDGIEFLDRADRLRHWMWQAAAIVGPEATSAARAAAEAWLKEIER